MEKTIEKFIIYLCNRAIRYNNDEVKIEKYKMKYIKKIPKFFFRRLESNFESYQSAVLNQNLIGKKRFSMDLQASIYDCKYKMKKIEDLVKLLTTKKHKFGFTKRNKEIQLFTDFDKLCSYLNDSELDQQEGIEILIYMIKLNLSSSSIKNIADDKLYNKYYLAAKNYIEGSISKLKDNLVLQNQPVLKAAIDELISLEKTKDVYNACKLFEKHYLNKTDYNYDDIKIITKSLLDLNISGEYVKIIKNALVNPLRKEKVVEELKEITFTKSEQKSNLLTDDEYKRLKKELNTYFDFYNVKLIRRLTKEEINHCMDILVRLDEIDRIHQFLYAVGQQNHLNEQKHPITYYVSIYNKLKYYKDKLGIKEQLKNIEDYLKEMFICDDADYVFWKNQIEVELNKIIQLLPTNYEYEIEEAKKRVFSLK